MATTGSASLDGKTADATSPDALIIGHYGFRNLGDEAILAGMLNLLRERYPRRRWTVVSGDPSDTEVRHGVAAIDRTDIPAVLSAAYRAGMVIVGGGGLLSDQWGFRPRHVLSRRAGDIPGYLGPALAAGGAGGRVLVWGVGVGPFLDPRSPSWVRALAEVASGFSVRTEQDREELESLGVRDAIVAADPAWLVEPQALPSDLNTVLAGLPRPLVAVAPRSWGEVSDRTRREREMARALGAFSRKHGGAVMMFPMQELGSGEFNDRRCCERIAARMDAYHVLIAPPDLTPGQMITALSRCDFALNMRLHGTILAAKGRTPSASISYDPKVARLAGELGLGDWCLTDDQVSRGGLTEALESMLGGFPDLSFFMYQQEESMRPRARRIEPPADAIMSERSRAGGPTDGQAVGGEMTLALARNLSETSARLDDARDDSRNLSARLDRRRRAHEEAERKFRSAQEYLRFAERRGDLLQLELDNLRQTRAMRLVAKYWRVRHRLRRRVMTLPVPRPSDSSRFEHRKTAIPDHVTERITDSRGVVVFPLNIEWHIHLFQRPQQLAQAFARLGYTVVYDNSNQGDPGWEEIEPRLFLYNGPPETLHGLPDPLVWALTYNWELAAAYPDGARVLYDWIDELDVFDGHDPNRLKRLHALALSEASITSATARSLLNRAEERRPDTLYLPNGVEFERFADWRVSPPAHPALRRLLAEGRPIAGYYGAIARWMDYDLLTEVAVARDDWSFLLIGPAYDKSAGNRLLFSLPNVEWVPAQPYRDLPRWLQSFDVAMIPFVVNDVTISTSPLKLFEYFAGGKPVVCSLMPEVTAFSEVRAYRDAQEMSEALDMALADSRDPRIRDRLRQRGEENSWSARVRTIAEILEPAPEGE